MVQVNTGTQYERKIGRILLGDKALDYRWTVWKVKVDGGKIVTYEDAANEEIQKAYVQGKSGCVITTMGNKYLIDFGNMKQINEATKYEREIIKEQYSIRSRALWLWQDDNGKFMPYRKEDCKTIEDQFQAKAEQFVASISQTNYDIDLSNLTQTNQDTKKVRNMKRVPLEIFIDSEVWEWEEDKGFSLYGPNEAKAIESAYKNKQPKLTFTANSCNYTIDFCKMTQTNDNTGKTRAIRRIPFAAPLSSPAAVAAQAAPAAPANGDPLWECNSDSGFVKYPPAFCAALNAALKSGQTTYAYNYNNTAYLIDFTKMQQTNQETNKVRSIRTTVASLPAAVSVAVPGKSQPPGCKLAALSASSAEFGKVKGLFDKTMSGKYKSFDVTLLINPHAKSRYNNCVNLIKAENSAYPKTLLLFHGTSSTNPKAIYEGYYENFDVAHSKQGLWGRGVYFACNAFYSCNGYAYKSNNNTYSILVAEVAVGNYCDYQKNTDSSLIHAPNLPGDPHRRYDSVSGITQGTRVFIIYNSNQAYSKYLITYTV
eukprot:TRINITY_DN3297_c0_g1_i16.p1 TRINITY_DN3297_c0_g1~~TRINITY_DN3297_c0_g1_i16.p1  ORF type:complete len:540 (+),score=130.04 TRINITY_DN3297_c0_g1_i16:244-1863(+)